MITSIIFSKDRALQLDLTLTSIKCNFPQCRQLLVIYTASKEHAKSYEILINEHKDVTFYEQTFSLFLDISNAIDISNDYLCFFTDDCIVYRKVPFEIDKIVRTFDGSFFKDQDGKGIDFACMSLRLGSNTNQRQSDQNMFYDILPPKDRFAEVDIASTETLLIWDRTILTPGGYWSYALSVDGHIFEKKVIQPYCHELFMLDRHYGQWDQTPNEFESKLQRYWFEAPRIMAAPKTSCVVNSPNNRVNTNTPNRSGDIYTMDAALLLDKYVNGQRIKLENLNFDNIQCPHTEIDLVKGLV